jgi:rhodanese-related sulfurtransferase
MSSLNAGSGGDLPKIQQIGKDEMKQIIEDYENGGRDDSGYLVLDVRGEDEVMMTGKVSPGVITLPLPLIMAKNVFAMDEEDFEDLCGFEKPQLDETLVFTCAAGIRSQQAAIFAAQAGYGNLVNYMGGAKEWF